MGITGTTLLGGLEARLREKLPPDWAVSLRREARTSAERRPDAYLEIRSPSGEAATLAIEVRDRLDARSIADAVAQARGFSADAVLVAAPYLSERARGILRDQAEGYADATGNLRLRLDRPPVFIEVGGASSNPWPESDEPLRTLKGPGAGRVIRALCEVRPPYGVRQLAKLAGAPPSTTSRVLSLLDREALVGRGERSEVVSVDWRNLIRRWAQDYSLVRSNRTATYIEPRGLPALLKKLAGANFSYCVTGSLAAAARAPLTPPRLGVVFVADMVLAADRLGVREAEAGANLLLAEPFDKVVFERTWRNDGVTYAGMAQVAVDLLTGPGRSPSEGEGVLRWMEANEDAWRT